MKGYIAAPPPPIFERLSALSDATRSRLLLLLERQELTVGELCSVLQLPQSTVSRHLKILDTEGWVAARAEGTSRRYRMAAEGLEEPAGELWRLVRGEVAASSAARSDAERLAGVLRQRRTRSQAFFSSAAGDWAVLRRELFGVAADLHPLLGLLDAEWTVGDLGCGTGTTAAALAPFVRRVVAVDDSPAMLHAAQARLDGFANVEIVPGDLARLPLPDASLDAAVLSLVLHHVAEPDAVLAEVRRTLRPGGRVLVVDMAPHEREEFRQEMGHLWLGFAAERLAAWLAAGWTGFHHRILPADPQARGPLLFAASARRADHP